MRLKRFIFLAVLIGGPLTFYALRPEAQTPRQELARLRESIESERPNEEHTLRRLERLTRDARELGDGDLLADLLDARATYLTEIGSADGARRDLQELLREHRPGDPELRLRLALTEVEAGNRAAGLRALRELVRDEADMLAAWVELGTLQETTARERLVEAKAILRPLTIAADHEHASTLIDKLAAQDPEDQLRTATIFAVRRLYRASDETELARALTLTDQASEELAQARKAYSKSFTLGLERRAITGFLRILVDAGEAELAVQTGMLGLQTPALRDNPDTARLLIELLLAREDYTNASRVAQLSRESTMALDADHLRLLCLALYRGEAWGPLAVTAGQLGSIARGDDPAIANLYSGFALATTDRVRRAARLLRDFATSKTPEPFPGARAQAWFTLARLARESGDAAGEQESLRGGLALEADDHGAEWIRLAELQEATTHGGYRTPLKSYSRGMSQAPRFTTQLIDKWIELGERAIAAGGRDVASIDRALRAGARIYPIGEVEPYLYYRLAQTNIEAERVANAATILMRLLEEYPGLLPAVDLRIECYRLQNRRTDEVEWIVHRAELAGPDEQSRALLTRIDPSEFSGSQLVRLMSADPDNIGRLEVARALIASGRDEEALIALGAAKNGKLDAERVEEGDILFRLGRFKAALDSYFAIDRTGPSAPDAVSRSVLSSYYIGKRGRIPLILEELMEAPGDPQQHRLLAGDLYLRIGDPSAADQLYRQYEEKETGDYDVLLRCAIASMLVAKTAEPEERQGQLVRAMSHIDRAEALSVSPEALVARLLLALSNGDERERDFAAREISGYDAQSAPLLRALAALASESWTEVRGIIDAERDRVAYSLPNDAVWGLLYVCSEVQLGKAPRTPASFGKNGSACLKFWNGTQADPRSHASFSELLLAAETPGFELYALQLLDDFTPQNAGTMWPAFLEARLLLRLGEDWQARERALALVNAHPDFLAAWTLLERIEARRLGPTHPDLVKLRRRRDIAQNQTLERADRALSQVEDKLAQGQFEPAAEQAQALVEAAPGWHEVGALLAQARIGQGRGRDALRIYDNLCLQRDRKVGVLYVNDYVDTLRLLRLRGKEPITAQLAANTLDQLIAAYPRKPAPVLARAEVDLDWDPANVAICVTRALRRLDDFRASLGTRTLEALEPGTLEQWVEFYWRLDREMALEVLTEQRDLAPGQPEAWRLLGKLYREQGQLIESRNALRRLARMLPDAATQLELAETAIALGLPHGSISRHLREAGRLGAETDGLRARMLSAESQINQGRRATSTAAIESLAEIWERRAELPRAQLPALGALYARALLSRSQPQDKLTAIEVLDVAIPLTRDPYGRAQLQALRGFAGLENSALAD